MTNPENNGEYFSTSFDHLDAAEQKFSAVVFEDCRFNTCNFSSAIFEQCKFIDCEFSSSNLSNINISRSRFLDVSFNECKLVGVDWTKADWPRHNFSAAFAFNDCIINDSSFFGLNFSELKILRCKAQDVDFRKGMFVKAKFCYTDFSNSLFAKTDLTEADFSEAENYNIDIFNNQITGARFSRLEALNLLDSLDIELVD